MGKLTLWGIKIRGQGAGSMGQGAGGTQGVGGRVQGAGCRVQSAEYRWGSRRVMISDVVGVHRIIGKHDHDCALPAQYTKHSNA